jgi:hypothetical protein
MEILTIVLLFTGMTSLIILVLLLQDVEVQKKMFRRYVRQIEKFGRIESKVTWWQMKRAMFVWSGWFYHPSNRSHLDLVVVQSERILRMIGRGYRSG